MDFWGTLFGRRAAAHASDEEPRVRKRDAAASTAVTVGVGPRYGKPYGIARAQPLAIATVYRCVDVLSSTIASLSFQYMKHKNGCYVEDTNSPINYLLNVQPQPEMSAVDFWTYALQQMLLQGNAYIYPRYIQGELTDLVLCHGVEPDAINSTYTINDVWSGVSGTFGENEIIHLYLHTVDGRTGISVLEHARQTIATAHVANDETESRFGNGGMPRGLITNNRQQSIGFGEYDDDQLRDAAVDITDQLRTNSIAALPGQAGFIQLTMSSSDMQFLETRKFTVREICRFFGVHPSFVFDDTSNNYKSAELANVAFLSQTLDPILKRIEAEFNRKMIPQTLYDKRIFRFDRSGLYSLDLSTRANYLKDMLGIGAMTVNDIREYENLPPVEGGDTVYISTNLAQLNSAKLAGGGVLPTETKEDEDE